jgi:hypothetical protein
MPVKIPFEDFLARDANGLASCRFYREYKT